MPTRTRQSNKRRPVRPEVQITPTASGIPEEWQQPSAPRQPADRRTRGSPAGQRPAEPSQWQQSPNYRRRSSSRAAQQQPSQTDSVQAPAPAQGTRRRRKKRPPLSTVLFPKQAQRARNRRRRHAAPDSRAERQKQRLKRQRRYLLLSRLFTMLLILCMGILALTLFFKVETVTIDGRSRYTNSQLLETAAIEQGDNLFLLSKRAIRKRLLDAYPYLDHVQVEQKPPNTVILHVEDATPAAAVGSGTTYYYMDASGKLLEQVSLDRLGDIPVVTGVTVDHVEVGKRLNMRRDERLRQLTTLLTALEDQELMSRVDFINLSDMANVRIGCDGHMYIRFGTMDKLDYKMRFAKKFVEETSPSLYCEIEVSGEILWEGHESYRVIPVSEEEVAAQSRDLEAAVGSDGELINPDAETGTEPPTAPILPGTPQTDGENPDEDGEDSTGQQSSSNKPKDSDNNSDDDESDDDDSDDDEKSTSNAPSFTFPGTGSAGNWRDSM